MCCYLQSHNTIRRRVFIRKMLQNLPFELRHDVFILLPVQHDILNVALVCKAWNTCVTRFLWVAPEIRTAKGWRSFLHVARDSNHQNPGAGNTLHDYAKLVREINLVFLPLEVRGSTVIDDEAMALVINNCRNLRALRVPSCQLLTEAAFLNIAEKHSRILELSLDNTTISDMALCAIISSNTYLQAIDLSRCRQISDASILVIAQHCPRLTSVHLDQCKDITDDPIATLAAGCPDLRFLSLSDCSSVSDASLLAVSAHCPNLDTLVMQRLTRVTDVSVIAIARGCRHLRLLDISATNLITERGLLAVCRNCPELDTLDFSYCFHLFRYVYQVLALSLKLTMLNRRKIVKVAVDAVDEIKSAKDRGDWIKWVAAGGLPGPVGLENLSKSLYELSLISAPLTQRDQ